MERRLVRLLVGLTAAIAGSAPARATPLPANPGPANNNGGINWAVFLDLEALSGPIAVVGLTTANTGLAGASFSIEVFTRAGTSLGGPVGSGPGSSPAGWTSLGVVSAMQGPVTDGVSLPIDIPDIVLAPGGVTGVALRFTGAGPRYFGLGTPPLETYQDANLRLVTSDARSAPFTTNGTWWSSRALVGQIEYIPEPATLVLIALTALTLVRRSPRR